MNCPFHILILLLKYHERQCRNARPCGQKIVLTDVGPILIIALRQDHGTLRAR